MEISCGNGERSNVSMTASMKTMVGMLRADGVAVIQDALLAFRNVPGDEAHDKQSAGDCLGLVINEDCSSNRDGDEEANGDDAGNDDADNDQDDNDDADNDDADHDDADNDDDTISCRRVSKAQVRPSSFTLGAFLCLL